MYVVLPYSNATERFTFYIIPRVQLVFDRRARKAVILGCTMTACTVDWRPVSPCRDFTVKLSGLYVIRLASHRTCLTSHHWAVSEDPAVSLPGSNLIIYYHKNLKNLDTWKNCCNHLKNLYIWAISWDYGTFRPPLTHNAHAQLSSGARCLIFGRTLHLLPYFMCANSEGSCETVRMRRLALAFTGR